MKQELEKHLNGNNELSSSRNNFIDFNGKSKVALKMKCQKSLPITPLSMFKNKENKDTKMIKSIVSEKNELTKRVEELIDELENEKKNSADLEDLVKVLNQNRKNLEAELIWLKKQENVSLNDHN